jgi:hypothetical protein
MVAAVRARAPEFVLLVGQDALVHSAGTTRRVVIFISPHGPGYTARQQVGDVENRFFAFFDDD